MSGAATHARPTAAQRRLLAALERHPVEAVPVRTEPGTAGRWGPVGFYALLDGRGGERYRRVPEARIVALIERGWAKVTGGPRHRPLLMLTEAGRLALEAGER